MQTNWVLELALDSLIVIMVGAFIIHARTKNDKLRYRSLMVIAMAGLSFATAAVLKRLPIPLPQDQAEAGRAGWLVELVLNALLVAIVIGVFVYTRGRDDRRRRWGFATVACAGGLFAAGAVLKWILIWA